MFLFRRHAVSDHDLSAYVDGELDARVHARVEAHLEGCATCREALAELRGVKRALSALAKSEAPRSFALREADVAAPERRPAAGALVRATPLLTGVAAIAFVAFWALVGVDLANDSSGESSELPAELAGVMDDADEAGDLDLTLPEVAESLEDDAQDGAAPPADAEERAADGDFDPAAPSGADDIEERDAPPEPLTFEEADDDDDDRIGLRIAQASLAGVAAVASVALAWVSWRRRA